MNITKADVFGVWELLSLESFDNNNIVSYPIGKDVQGFLIYEPNGYMAAVLSSKNRHLVTPESLPEAWHGIFIAGNAAYSGKFSTDGENIYHHIEVSSCPNLVGITEKRKILVAEKNSFVVSTDPTQSAVSDSTIVVKFKRRI